MIESRDGASGAIGINYAKRQEPDGYNLLFCSVQHLMRVPGAREVSWALDDFIPIGTAVGTPVVFTARGDAPYKTIPEMIAYAKQNPNKVTMGTGGPATLSHLHTWMLQSLTGGQFTYVPFRGVGPAVAAQLAGTVQLTSTFAALVNQHVQAGKLQFLSVTSRERSRLLSDVPTFKELGIDLVDVVKIAMFAPKGTPPDVVKKLEYALKEAVNSPEYIELTRKAQSEFYYLGSSDSLSEIKADFAYWEKQLSAFPLPPQ